MDIKIYSEEIALEIRNKMLNYVDRKNIKLYKELFTYNFDDGKKLRPVTAVMITQALNGDKQQILEIISVVEMLHIASLMLDDIVDMDKERRGKMTSHEIMGIGRTAMGAGKLMTMAFKIGMERSIVIFDVLKVAVDEMIDGNTLDLVGADYNEEVYYNIIKGKTAHLFAAASKIGAIVATSKDEYINSFFLYGMSLGKAYQLADDVVDIIVSCDNGIPIGDIKEGKITLALIHLYNNTDDNKIKDIIKRIENKEVTPEDLEYLKGALAFGNSLEYVENKIKQEISMCESIIDNIPKSEYTIMLRELPTYCVNKIKEEI